MLLVMSAEGRGGVEKSQTRLCRPYIRQVAHAVLRDDRRILNPVEIHSSTLE